MTLIVTTINLKPEARNFPIECLTIDDVFFVNPLALGFVTDVVYCDDISKLTHSLR